MQPSDLYHYLRPIESALQTWATLPRSMARIGRVRKENGVQIRYATISKHNGGLHRELVGRRSAIPSLGRGFHRRARRTRLQNDVLAEKKSGGVMPAYARYIAIPSSRFISNEWRTPSELSPAATHGALVGICHSYSGKHLQRILAGSPPHLSHHDSGGQNLRPP